MDFLYYNSIASGYEKRHVPAYVPSGASDENRTRNLSLGSWCFATKLRSHHQNAVQWYKNGAGNVTWTRDLRITNALLYQLSYSSTGMNLWQLVQRREYPTFCTILLYHKFSVCQEVSKKFSEKSKKRLKLPGRCAIMIGYCKNAVSRTGIPPADPALFCKKVEKNNWNRRKDVL